MEGLYLYCVRERADNSSFSLKGIDGRGEVFAFPYQELEAVVSKVSLEEFSSEEIQKKAQEDLNWIKEKAVIHEKIIEEAMRKGDEFISIIPMKFGTIFKEEKNLEETLNRHYEQFKTALKRLEGKQEWSIKVYLVDKKRLEERTKEENKMIKEREKEIASLPEGMAFFMEEELKEVILREVKKGLNNIGELIFEGLKKQAVDAVRCKILKSELTGRHELMVVNAAYLVLEEKVEDFKKEVNQLNQWGLKNGLSVEWSGPWPAYNFI